MKKLIKLGVVAVLVIVMLIPVHIIHAGPQVFYGFVESTRLSRNTYLHRATRITAAGLVDFSVLEIPLDDPYLNVGVFNSQVEFGLKQPVTTLLAAHGAIAGTNGDFFGLAGRHSVPLGFEMIDSEMSAQGGNSHASFLLGDYGAFIEYVTPSVSLILDGGRPFHVGLVNMVVDLAFPSFLTRGYISHTASIDERLGMSYKLVVEDGIITNITFFGVEVPENGFVVIMNPETFQANEHLFYVGQQAEMEIYANVNLEAVHTAISGDNRILHHGEIPNIPATRATARHPRTLLGLNAAGDRLILMTIDGRNHSIGASLAEAATMMADFGAYHAINLDGGGSTTMAARLPGAALGLVNSPSEGGRQRNVINSIGVVNSSSLGNITTLQFSGIGRYIPVGIAQNFDIIGFDDYMNPMPIPPGLAEITVTNGHAVGFEAGLEGLQGIVAHSPDPVYVQARFGDIVAEARFHGIFINQIIPSVGYISGQTWLSFRGVDNFGRGVALSPSSLNFQVYPPYLGAMDGNWFIPYPYTEAVASNGWLGVAAHHARAFVPVILNPYYDGIYGLPQNTMAADIHRRYFMEMPGYGEFDLMFFGNPQIDNPWGYDSFYEFGNFVIHLDARGGGFMAANPAQWQWLAADLANTAAQTIIIYTNVPPMYFDNRAEFQILHRKLRNLADEGRDIFVVSVGGPNTWTFLWDGLRYINLAYAYKYLCECDYLYDYDCLCDIITEQLMYLSILRIRFGLDSMYYSVERIFD